MRIITVVMNEDTIDNRSSDTVSMMDYGFSMYSLDNIVSDKEKLGNIKVNLGKDEYVDIMSVKPITVLNNNQKNNRNVTYNIETKEVAAPVKVGDEVGKINVYEDGKFMYSVGLTVMKDVEKANMFTVFIRNLKDIISVSL